MSDLKKKYYDGFQIHKILNEELDSGETIMRILSRFADEPFAQPDITEDDVKEFCKKRCWVVLTSDLYHEMIQRWSSAQPDLEDIKNQALNCSAELLKLVALIGRHNKEDEP